MGATFTRRKGRARPARDWRGAILYWLRRFLAFAALSLLAIGLALWWAARWTPSRDQFPLQGVTIDADNGEVHWGSIKAAGADFAYIFATGGARRVDPVYARSMAAGREAGLRTGPIHRYDLCRLATDQAANFIRRVPRRADALPAVVWLDYNDRCPERPTRALLLSEL